MSILCATVFALATQQVLAFPGGGASALCKALAERTNLPVACLVYDEKEVKPFTLKWLESKDLDRLMWPVGKHHLLRSERGIGLYRGGLPSLIIDADERYLSKLKAFPLPKDAANSGRVSIQTSDASALRVASLGRLQLSKPLSIHWMYQRLGVAVYARDVTEAQLLSTVAAAIGAKFSESREEYRLEFDPRSYRTRAIESFTGPRPVGYPQFKWGSRYSLAVKTLAIEILKAISDSQLEKACEANNGSVSFLVARGTPLHRAVLGKLDAVEELSQEKDKSFKQLADGYVILLSRIDLSKQPRAVFDPPAQFGALFRSIDNPETWVAL